MAALLLVTVIVGSLPVTAQGLMRFSVTQVRQLDVGAPVVRAYLDLTDTEGRPLEALPESSLTATLGEWPAEPVNVVPFSAVQQGIAYVFLVDVSKSLSLDLFQQMVRGIETWIAGMGELDRAAIIAFGESSRLIVDFTDSRAELLAGLESLGPTDNETLLHQALADALDLNRRLDVDLPGRRAVVIFSDGKDEGSTFEAEDILARLRGDGSPVYAIGYSRLRDPAERRTYLNLLQRFASNSGGAFFATEETRFAEAYESIRQTIRQVWITDFLCAECRADGNLHRLQVQVTLDEHVLSSGGSVRLLPLVKSAVTAPTESAARDASPVTVEPAAPSEPRRGLPSELGPWLVALAVLAAVLILWGVLTARRRRRRQEFQPAAHTPPPSSPIDPLSEPSVLDPPFPVPLPGQRSFRPPKKFAPLAPSSTPLAAPPKQVRLIVVRGSRKGRQYSFVVRERAVVGKRSSNDCVLAEENGIDAVQFELFHERGELFIENLSDRLPTLIAGHSLTGRVRLDNDTLLGTGETVLRLVFH
jgi:VWFA-related protein